MAKYMLFPFDKVEKDSNIIIYGAGEMGECLKEQLKITNYCNIICFLDKDYENIKTVDQYNCVNPKNYINYKYDYIIVASDIYKDEINTLLLSMGVEKHKIILLEDKYDMMNINKGITPASADWNRYYKEAEIGAESQYKFIVQPIVNEFSLFNSNSIVLDFACGKGRIAEIVKNSCKTLFCCDISNEAIDYCKERFSDSENVKYIYGKEDKIELINNSMDFIYSWDAMVHFSYRNIDRYLSEFYRILNSGGYAFIHHSNLMNNTDVTLKSEKWYENVHCRSNISKEDVKFIAEKYGFYVMCQKTLDWGEYKSLDCISILKKK